MSEIEKRIKEKVGCEPLELLNRLPMVERNREGLKLFERARIVFKSGIETMAYVAGKRESGIVNEDMIIYGNFLNLETVLPFGPCYHSALFSEIKEYNPLEIEKR
jgi:hypothetical protein